MRIRLQRRRVVFALEAPFSFQNSAGTIHSWLSVELRYAGSEFKLHTPESEELWDKMKLTVVIPALNEELAIGSTIERLLAARSHITQTSPIEEVEVIVVSDGSTDRTAQIAAGFDGVQVVVFEQNRGYGAAIKRGFAEGTGEVVGFLDADGTCDPRFFADLCNALEADHADVAIGSRMGSGSKMPRVRRLGNRIYALVLSMLSNRVVSDTASGMRVIRRSTLPQLYPLPDGLHFTPAMSARVLMDDQLRIVERPMSYEERIGDSKLHVLRDGVRFFQTIFQMSLMWRPARCFFVVGIAFLFMTGLLALYPVETWLRMGRLPEDMIYRLLFCSLAGTLGATLFSAGFVADLLRQLWDQRARTATFSGMLLNAFFSFRVATVVAGLGAMACVWLVGEGVWTRFTSGYVLIHWSRVVLAGLICFALVQLLVTVLLANLIRFHLDRVSSQPEFKTSSLPKGLLQLSQTTPFHAPITTEPSREPAIHI